jgi:hypothetical protein
MNEDLAKAKLSAAENMVNTQLAHALGRAKAYAEKNVRYNWGGKTEEQLDCSGLMVKCYPLLFDGTEKQFTQLKDWLFTDFDIHTIEVGDIIFFAGQNNQSRVSHVGIIEEVKIDLVGIIHASQTRGGVVRDAFNIHNNAFNRISILESYTAIAVAKIRPFLFRRFLNDEIMRSVQDV